MGLSKWVAGLVPKDPSREWPAGSISSLEFDASSGRLNGIPLEAPVTSARPLGPADQSSGGTDDSDLDYRALGLQVSCFEGSIAHFRVITEPEGRDTARDRSFQAGELLLHTEGRSLRLTGRMSEEDVMAALGTPGETGPVGNDRVHTFLVERCMVETYHNPGTGSLVEVVMALRNTDDMSGGATFGTDRGAGAGR